MIKCYYWRILFLSSTRIKWLVICMYWFHCYSLEPEKKYYYVFGDSYGWSKEYSFKAPPIPGPDVTTRVIAFGGMYIWMCVCVYMHVHTCMYICRCTLLWPSSSPTTVKMSLSIALHCKLIDLFFMLPYHTYLLCAKCCNCILCGNVWGSKGLFCCQIAIAISDTLIVQTLGMASMMTVGKCFLMNNQLWTLLNVFFRNWIAQILSSLLEICHMLMDMLLRYVLVHMSYIHVCDMWQR